MSDYLLKIQVKNNRLMRLMAEHGIPTLSELSRQSGINVNRLCAVANLKVPLLNHSGDVSYVLGQLSDFFCEPAESLVPPELHGCDGLERNVSWRELSSVDLESFMLEWHDPDDDVFQVERQEIVAKVLKQLTPREEKVIRKRFGIGEADLTLEETAAALNITSRERVRQLECKALRKIRNNPTMRSALREVM